MSYSTCDLHSDPFSYETLISSAKNNVQIVFAQLTELTFLCN